MDVDDVGGEEVDVGDGGRVVPSSFRDSMRWTAFSWSAFRLLDAMVVTVCYVLFIYLIFGMWYVSNDFKS